jgi:hypothetical protein
MTNKLHSVAIRIRLRAEDLLDEKDYLTAASDFALAADHYRAAGEAEMADYCLTEEAKCMAKHYGPEPAEAFSQAA